jgi:hypothetical protein
MRRIRCKMKSPSRRLRGRPNSGKPDGIGRSSGRAYEWCLAEVRPERFIPYDRANSGDASLSEVLMAYGFDRFLTTHTGSLPRPDDLIRAMYAKEEGVPVDRAALAARISKAVAEVVKKQVGSSVDLVNDGEMSKPSYAQCVDK